MKLLPLFVLLPGFAALSAFGAAAPSNEPTPAAVLPVFADGPAKGRNASYRAEKFDAWLDANQRLWVQPTEGGQPVGPPVVCYTRCNYTRSARSVWREVVKITKPPAPTQQAAKVEWAGELEDGVDFTQAIEFSPAGVAMLVTFKDPSTAAVKDAPSRLLTWARLPAVPGVVLGTPPEKIAELTAGCALQYFRTGQKTPTPYSFSEPMTEVFYAVERTESAGLWGSRKVVVLTPATKERGSAPTHAAGLLASYTKAPPHAGYYVGRYSFTKERDKRLTVQVQ